MLPKLDVPTYLNKDFVKKYRLTKLKPVSVADIPCYRQVLCKYFVMGSCNRGDTCAYSHNTSKFPCFAFHVQKNCKKSNCVYSHDPNTFNKFDYDKGKKDFVFMSTLK